MINHSLMLLKVIERSLKSYCSWPNVSTLQSSVFIRDDRCEDIGSISIPWRTMSYTLKDHVIYPQGPCPIPSRTMSYTLKDHVLYPQGPCPIPSTTMSYTLNDHVLYPSTTMSYTLNDHVLYPQGSRPWGYKYDVVIRPWGYKYGSYLHNDHPW